MFTDFSFLDLEDPDTIKRGRNTYSGAIKSSESIQFGYSTERTVYVSCCGKCTHSHYASTWGLL